MKATQISPTSGLFRYFRSKNGKEGHVREGELLQCLSVSPEPLCYRQHSHTPQLGTVPPEPYLSGCRSSERIRVTSQVRHAQHLALDDGILTQIPSK